MGSVDADDYISNFSNRGSEVDIYATEGGSKELSAVGYDKWMAERLFERDWIIVPTLQGQFTYAYSSLMRMEHQSQHQKYLLPWD